jgi:Flp pilus assembly protein TadD
VKPDQAGYYSNLGIVLRARGKLDEALDAYRQSIRLDRGNADVHSNMGVLLRAQGKPEAAHRTAMRLAPSHAEACHNLGVLLAASDRVKEAIECYYKTANPVHLCARTRLAAALCMLGEREKAVVLEA